jgi:hypothetical protein
MYMIITATKKFKKDTKSHDNAGDILVLSNLFSHISVLVPISQGILRRLKPSPSPLEAPQHLRHWQSSWSAAEYSAWQHVGRLKYLQPFWLYNTMGCTHQNYKAAYTLKKKSQAVRELQISVPSLESKLGYMTIRPAQQICSLIISVQLMLKARVFNSHYRLLVQRQTLGLACLTRGAAVNGT